MNKKLCFCGSGKTHDKCHAEIGENSALSYLFEAFKIIDEDIKNATPTPQCQHNCSECCRDYFDVSPLEFFGIYKFIQEKFTGFYNSRLHRQARMIMPKFEPLYDDKLNIRLLQPCIFLDNRTEKCKIYEVRPLVCRLYGYYSAFSDCMKAENTLKIIPKELYEHHAKILNNLSNKRLPAIPLVYWFGNPIVQTDERLKELYALSFDKDINVCLKFISDNKFGIECYSRVEESENGYNIISPEMENKRQKIGFFERVKSILGKQK